MIRLRDYPLIAELERAALLNPDFRSPSAGWFSDKVDAANKALFGLTTREFFKSDDDDDDDAEEGDEEDGDDEDHPCYAILDLTEHEQAAELEKLGWDARDEYGRPLLVLQHILHPLLAAIAGEEDAKLPGPPGSDVKDWEASLADQARRFKPKR